MAKWLLKRDPKALFSGAKDALWNPLKKIKILYKYKYHIIYFFLEIIMKVWGWDCF